ncbi:hypothetical protein MUK42_34662 [Musa troglodytarum]|uniref:Uncharacterized protein n=1 Tax=Musa troglodytarum TaxID=320322 RepID=A0A9E7GLU3_9LILI|nr:hypothetical protein MUK42_34662 [Musa troglodytarum]
MLASLLDKLVLRGEGFIASAKKEEIEVFSVPINCASLGMADQADVNGRVEEPEKKDKKKKKDKEKSADSKEKTQDPAKLRMKLEKLDAKIDDLKAKKEEIIKQLFELEGAANN